MAARGAALLPEDSGYKEGCELVSETLSRASDAIPFESRLVKYITEAGDQLRRATDNHKMQDLSTATAQIMKPNFEQEFPAWIQRISKVAGCLKGVKLNTELTDEILAAIPVLVEMALHLQANPSIVGDALDALLMFCGPSGDELDFVVLEEAWLFEREIARSLGLCSNAGPHGDSAGVAGLPMI